MPQATSTDGDPVALSEEKQARRRAARELRDRLPAAQRAQASQRIAARIAGHPALLEPRTVFVYVSMGSEVETHSVIDWLEARGHHVLVPRLSGREAMQAVAFPGWSAMLPGALGISSPPTSAPVATDTDVALVPGLAFTLTGQRLGYGAGYYDRWLAAHPRTTPIALAFEAQIVPGLPTGTHDVAVPEIITESRRLIVVHDDHAREIF